MSVHSGKFATINNQGTARNWSINDSQALAKAVASNTAFGPARRKGVEEWTGNFSQYGKQPTVMPGDTFTFKGYTAPDNDSNGAGIIYEGSAVVRQLVVNWNFTGGEMINLAIDFDGHLAWTTQGVSGSVVLDPSTPTLPPIVLAKLQYSTDSGSTFTDWSDVSTATLTITNDVQEYVNSSTIVAAHLWKGRKAGNMDCTLSVVEHNTDRTRFSKGDDLVIRAFVDATTYWELKFMTVKDFTGIQLDRETARIIQQTVNMEFNGVKVSDGSLGSIKLPDTTTWWPVAQS